MSLRRFFYTCVLFFPTYLAAFCCDQGQFYLKASSGVSFSETAKINATPLEWDASPQGYNSRLGNTGIISAGIGYEFPCILALDVTVAYRPGYNYRKFQTTSASDTPGFLGEKTRQFDLDVYTAMFNVYLSGKGVEWLEWNWECIPVKIYPLVGAGIGYNQLNINNFRSVPTAVPVLDCQGHPFVEPGTFGSESPLTERFHFAYQIMAGVEARICDQWAISLGYRYFDAGRFNGPQYIRNPCGEAVNVKGNVWKIDFKANEIFFELKVYL